MQTVSQVLTHGRTELAKVIVGQEELINQCLLTVLCGGHALLEGVPGIAKTLVIKSFARLFALEFRRVQCTSDLMPADIIGSNVLNLSTSAFSLHRGPLFTDLLLADEVNRMPPRTQAAVLEAMEERQITIDGATHRCHSFLPSLPHRIQSSLKAPILCRKRSWTVSAQDQGRLSRRRSRKSRSCNIITKALTPTIWTPPISLLSPLKCWRRRARKFAA